MVPRFLCFPLSLPVVATLVRSALLHSLRFAPSVRSVRSLRPTCPCAFPSRSHSDRFRPLDFAFLFVLVYISFPPPSLHHN